MIANESFDAAHWCDRVKAEGLGIQPEIIDDAKSVRYYEGSTSWSSTEAIALKAEMELSGKVADVHDELVRRYGVDRVVNRS